MQSKQLQLKQRPPKQSQMQQQQIQKKTLFYDQEKSQNVQPFNTLKQPVQSLRPINLGINFQLPQQKINPFQNTQQKINNFQMGHRQIKQFQISASSMRRELDQNTNNTNQIIENIKNQYYSPQQQNLQVIPYKLIQQSHNNQMTQFLRNTNNQFQQNQLNPQNNDLSNQLQIGFNQLMSRPLQRIFQSQDRQKKKQLLLEELKTESVAIFDNDDFIAPKNNQINNNSSINDLLSKVSFEVKCLQKTCKLKVEESQYSHQLNYFNVNQQNQLYLPAMVSIKTQEMESAETETRVGVDLICLIDRSGSMSGQKIKMVQQTLIALLDFLGDQDRLQLITFHQKAQQLTPLKCVTEQNKEYSQ